MELRILQTLVRRWCVRAFGQEVADNHRERNHRFLEEALELGQSLGCSREDAHVLVNYVYGRPAGKPGQEVGGVLITLAALCGAHANLSMDTEAKMELGRINRPEVLAKIQAKQAAKVRDIPLSPLPGQVNAPPPPMHCTSCNVVRHTYRAAVGDSAGAGALCCAHCSRVLLPPKPEPPPLRDVREGQLPRPERAGGMPASYEPATRKPEFAPPGQSAQVRRNTFHQHASGCRCEGCTIS
jgi:hypothetical protein